MRRFFLSFLALFLLVSPLTAQEWNNLDFALPDLAGWKSLRMINPPQTVEKEGSSGRSLHITAPFSAYESGAVCQTVALPRVPEVAIFRLTGRIRTQGVQGNGASLYAYGRVDGQALNYTESAAIRGDAPWTAVRLDFIADDRIDSVRIGCQLTGGDGSAWFSDLTWQALPAPADVSLEPAARSYLDTFFHLVSQQVLYRERFDWTALRRTADRLAAGATTPAETYPAIRYILGRVNKHSGFIDPATAAAWAGTGDGEEETSELQPIEQATGKRLASGIAYLRIPHVNSGHEPTLRNFADSVRNLIVRLDGPNTKGWIVDLRENTGGNCWPMLTGLHPLLPDGPLGYFMAPDGSEATAWIKKKDKIFLDTSEMGQLSKGKYRLHRPKPRIAVLTSGQTTSSGEVVAVAFHGRKNFRSFGAPTGGYSTANSMFPMPDGALLNLTISVYANHLKKAFGAEITPDEVAEDALAAAERWLLQQ
ncbi:S41 family peptidase [Neolewinella lacunae]|uniref:S41 family peptidase n=1 Tax=Neolewinella lacunae TaxID=1517758 RepID=A0A923TAR3_9BACT|nr:S41 family peptidase [Neolewinella lacunae]MBC6996744.1 S41 family peptidase [Neolewinella lacunae]MDN3633391.1 S41 family peptidase [Neolewinella lacunae]